MTQCGYQRIHYLSLMSSLTVSKYSLLHLTDNA
jgi:hypothetical protein